MTQLAFEMLNIFVQSRLTLMLLGGRTFMKPDAERPVDSAVELSKAELELIQGGGEQLGRDIGTGLNAAKGKAG